MYNHHAQCHKHIYLLPFAQFQETTRASLQTCSIDFTSHEDLLKAVVHISLWAICQA